MIDYTLLGKRIRKYRRKKGITQAALAELVDVSPNHISKIENGATKLSLPVLVGIADALEASLDALLLREFEETPRVYERELEEILDGCTSQQRLAVIHILEEIRAVLAQNPSDNPDE